MSNEKEYEREDVDPREVVKAHMEAQLKASVDKATLELAEAPFAPLFDWEVLAWGPYQLPFNPALDPGRIIKLGETAFIGVAVWLSAEMHENIAGYEGKIELHFWTSDTQRMEAVDALDYTCCIFPTDPCVRPAPGGGCIYTTVWEFKPERAACILETNICAHICNCANHTVPGYAAFVRHCWNWDPDTVFAPYRDPHVHPAGWGFDRPIRYMVYDPEEPCVCDPANPCP